MYLMVEYAVCVGVGVVGLGYVVFEYMVYEIFVLGGGGGY